MSAPAGGRPAAPFAAWPTDTFFQAERTMYFNGEGIQLVHVPHASTDGDVLVFFRSSDVIAAGDIYSTIGYPRIDVARGGHVNGVIEGLNRLIDLAISEQFTEGGTRIVPGRGRISDEFDVVEYRDMVTIVRDRVQAMIAKGQTLEQIKAAAADARLGPALRIDVGPVDDRAVRRGGLSQPHRQGRRVAVRRAASDSPAGRCVALAAPCRARPRRSSTSPAATTPSSTRISPSAFRGRRSATISACRSTTAPARSPTPGTPRGSRCPSTSAAPTRRPTSCAARSTCGSGTSATPRREQVVAIHIDISNFQQRRTVWMDGRPHPSRFAEHTWMGFSTGTWEGETLVVTTTHIKQMWHRRNGLPQSDQVTLTERFSLHGPVLTYVTITDDPVYLTEPLVKTTNMLRNPRPLAPQQLLYPCTAVVEIADQPRGAVPHYLPGQNHVPEGVRGGSTSCPRRRRAAAPPRCIRSSARRLK